MWTNSRLFVVHAQSCAGGTASSSCCSSVALARVTCCATVCSECSPSSQPASSSRPCGQRWRWSTAPCCLASRKRPSRHASRALRTAWTPARRCPLRTRSTATRLAVRAVVRSQVALLLGLNSARMGARRHFHLRRRDSGQRRVQNLRQGGRQHPVRSRSHTVRHACMRFMPLASGLRFLIPQRKQRVLSTH
jgi:hypothetical protein